MRRLGSIVILVSLVLMLAVAPAALALGSDWSDNFDGGSHQTWTVFGADTDNTAVFQNNRYELHAAAAPGVAEAIASYVNVTGASYTMRAHVQQITAGDNFLAYLMARTNATSGNAYAFGASSDGEHFWFGKLAGGVYANLDPSYIEATSFDVTSFYLKFTVAGATLLGKVWSATASEPDHWQIRATDASYSSGAGGVMLATYPTFGWDVVQVAFDDVSFSSPSEVWVDDGWAASAPGDMVGGHTFGYDAFATVQGGVNAVTAGGTVHVAAGTYAEHVVVNKSMDIRGAQYGIDPTASSARTIPANESTIDISGLTWPGGANVAIDITSGTSNVAVAGFSIVGSPTLYVADESDVRAWSNDITIQDNIMTGYLAVLYKGPGNNLNVSRNRMTVNKNGIVLQPGGVTGVTISGNKIMRGSSPAGDESAMYMTSATTVAVTGNTATGFVTNSGIAGSGNSHVTVAGNTFTGNKKGVSFWGSTTFVTIENNTIGSSLANGIEIKGQDISIANNSLTGNATGIMIGKDSLATERVTISHNDLSGNTTALAVTPAVVQMVTATGNWWGTAYAPTIAAKVTGNADFTPYYIDAAMTTLSEPLPAVVYVDDNYSDGAASGHTYGYDAFSKVQEGVTGVAAGGTVNVAAGTYNENLVTINKPLTLAGAGAPTTILDGGGVLASDGLVKIAHVTGPVTLQGFTLRNHGGDSAGTISLITVDHNSSAAPVTIQNNHFVGRSNGDLFDMGLWLYSGDGTITIQNNEFEKMWQAMLLERPRGGGAVLNNTVHDLRSGTSGGTLYEGEGFFAFTYGGDNVSSLLAVNGNTFSGFYGGDIAISGGYSGQAPAKFTNVEIKNNTLNAIGSGLERRHVGIILINAGTTALEAASGGVHNVTISGNTATTGGASSYGIQLAGPNNNVSIHDNTISGLNKGIATEERYAGAGFASGLAVHNNSLSGNVTAISNGSTDPALLIDASGNWLGSAVPGTVKAAVSGNVDYTPWLAVDTDMSGDPGFQGSFARLWVDDDSPQAGTAGRIQEAIGLVSGSTVNVAAGLYDERVVIDKALTLLGASHGVSKKGYAVPSGYAYDTATESVIRPSVAQPAPVVDIRADNVVLDGFVVAYQVGVSSFPADSNLQDLVEVSYGMSVDTGIQVVNNVLGPNYNAAAGGYGRSGFTVVGPRTLPLKNLVVRENKIFDAKNDGCGIMIVASYSAQYHGGVGTGYTDMSGSVIEDNEITGNHRSGIELAGGASGESAGGFLIKDNLITNNGWGGVADAANLKYGNGVTMVRGGSDKALLNPSGSRFVTFQGNTISGNEKNGIYFGSQNHDITLQQNTVQNNGGGGGGYSTWDGLRFDLDEAYYTGHTIRYDVLQNIAAHSNSITGNGAYGTRVIQTPTQGPVDATTNWWGSACGPSGVGPGNGDSVSANVTFSPWWTTATGPDTASVGPSGEIVIPTGASQSEAQAILSCAGSGKTVTFQGGSYPGGYTLANSGVTVSLNGSTVGSGSPAFTVTGDDITIEGPGLLDGSGNASSAILVQPGADNLTVQNLEIKNWANGVELAGNVTSFKVVGNWIHNNAGAALQINGAVTSIAGIVTIEGNLFKANSGPGVNNASAVSLLAEYNSWGDIAGPTGPNGDGVTGPVDITPWSFAELFIDVDPDALATGRHVNEGQDFDVKLKVAAAKVAGVTFKFTYDTARLTLASSTTATGWSCGDVGTPPAGTVYQQCYRSASELDGAAADVATFRFSQTPLPAGNGPWFATFDVSALPAETSAGASGGQRIYVNNAGFGATDRDITDADDGKITIDGLANFTGFVDLQGRSNDSGATIDVFNQAAIAGAIKLASASSASGGAFTTAYVAPYSMTIGSTYWLKIDKKLFLPTTMISDTLYADSGLLSVRPLTTLASVKLLGGDATNDDVISIGDLGCIGGDYGAAPHTCGVDGSSDVTGDGNVNILDLTLAAGNYGLNASPWTP